MDEWGNGDCMNEKRGGKPVVYTLKELNSVLGKISMTFAKLDLALRAIIVKRMMRETVFDENRKVIGWINELQGYLNQIANVTVLFDEKAEHSLIQAELKLTLTSLTGIKNCLISLYEVRNENDLEQYTPAIKTLAKKAQANVKNALDAVEDRVKIYNKENRRQLNFKIKWVTLKEDEE